MTFIGSSSRIFDYLWPITLFLSSHLTGPWTLPKMCEQLFAKMDLTAVAYGCMSTLLWCGAPSLLDPQEAFLSMCRQGNLP